LTSRTFCTQIEQRGGRHAKEKDARTVVDAIRFPETGRVEEQSYIEIRALWDVFLWRGASLEVLTPNWAGRHEPNYHGNL